MEDFPDCCGNYALLVPSQGIVGSDGTVEGAERWVR